MIAELGLAALCMAAAMAFFVMAGGFAGLSVRGATVGLPIRSAAVTQGILCLVAFICLTVCFLRTDLSVAVVTANSHVDKPWLYKLAGTWGNHEGSMLLWVTVLSVAGAFVAVAERRLDARTLSATLGAQGLIAIGFFAFLLVASNPFARLDPAPLQGMGLNPLLQDPGLAFHPPTLYVGYVGLSVAFSFAVGALLAGTIGPHFARAMRPWVLAAWIFLTLGITAGSYWAYYELGWGGWWFWDPVENASLMPWLAATALLHSVSVLATRDALRSWTIVLALIAFAMSMLGTFLVRSGILTSVHAFAVDPTRGAFILGLLLFYVGGSLLLFALRIGSVRQGSTFRLASRETALVGNNILLTSILGVVLLGTLYPLIAEALFAAKLSVGPPYFNKATVPMAFALLALLAVGPLLRWRDNRQVRNARGFVVPGLFAVGGLVWGFLASDVSSPLARAGLAIGCGLLPATVLPLVGRRLRLAPLATWGMVLAHAGIAVATIGMASDALFSRETLTVLQVGEQRSVGPWTVRLAAVEPLASENWVAVEAQLVVRHGTGQAFVLRPQSRSFIDPETTTSESALLSRIDGQLYAVLAAPADTDLARGEWRVRLWWKPWILFIWLGGAFVAFGGSLSLAGRWSRPFIRRRRSAQSARFA